MSSSTGSGGVAREKGTNDHTMSLMNFASEEDGHVNDGGVSGVGGGNDLYNNNNVNNVNPFGEESTNRSVRLLHTNNSSIMNITNCNPSTISGGGGGDGVVVKKSHDGVTTTTTTTLAVKAATKPPSPKQQRSFSRTQSKKSFLKELVFNPTSLSESGSGGVAAVGGAGEGSGSGTTSPRLDSTISSSSLSSSKSSLPSLRSILDPTTATPSTSASQTRTSQTSAGRDGQSFSSSFSSPSSSSSSQSSSTHRDVYDVQNDRNFDDVYDDFDDDGDDASYDLNDVCDNNKNNSSNKVQGGGGNHNSHTSRSHDDSVHSIDTADPHVIAIGIEVQDVEDNGTMKQQQQQQQTGHGVQDVYTNHHVGGNGFVDDKTDDTASAAGTQTTQTLMTTTATMSSSEEEQQQQHKSTDTNTTNTAGINDRVVQEGSRAMMRQHRQSQTEHPQYNQRRQRSSATVASTTANMNSSSSSSSSNSNNSYTTSPSSPIKRAAKIDPSIKVRSVSEPVIQQTKMLPGHGQENGMEEKKDDVDGHQQQGNNNGNETRRRTTMPSSTTSSTSVAMLEALVEEEYSSTHIVEPFVNDQSKVEPADAVTTTNPKAPHTAASLKPPSRPDGTAAIRSPRLQGRKNSGGDGSVSTSSNRSSGLSATDRQEKLKAARGALGMMTKREVYRPPPPPPPQSSLKVTGSSTLHRKASMISSLKDPPMVRPERSPSPINSPTGLATPPPPRQPKRMQSISSLAASPPEKPVRRPSLLPPSSSSPRHDYEVRGGGNEEEGYDGTEEMNPAGLMTKKNPPTMSGTAPTGSNATSKDVKDVHDDVDEDDADCNSSTNSGGVDLDDKTREQIIAQSAANAMQKRRPSSMSRTASSRSNGSGNSSSIYSTTSSTATAYTSNLGVATAAAVGTAGGKSVVDDKQAARDSRRAFARRAIPSSSSDSSGTDKRSMNISSFEAVATPRSRMTSFSSTGTSSSISSTDGVASSSSHHRRVSSSNHSRPSDEKAAYRSRPITRLSGASASSSSSFRPGAVPCVGGSQSTTKPRRISSIMSADMSVYIEDDESGEEEDGGTIPFGPVTTSDIAAGEMEVVNETEDLEAQAGVPVLLPGAFAVSGLNDDDRESPSGYDSGADDGDDEDNAAVECAPASAEHQVSLDPSVVAVGTDSPLEAELYEVDEGVAALEILTVEQLAEQKKEAEEEQRRKDCKKVMIIGIIVTLVIAAVSATVGILVPRTTTSDDGDDGDTSGGGVILSGWEATGSLTVPTEIIKDNIQFGSSVAISSEGTRLAVGLPGLVDPDSDPEASTGSVFIYDWVNGTSWEAISAITSPGSGGVVGENVGISTDGTRLVLGVPSSSQDGEGYVEVYEESPVPGEWELVNDIIFGGEDDTSFSANFGGSVSFSSDGTVVAVGDTDANNADDSVAGVGLVQVFQDSNETWTPLGGSIYGVQENGRFGRSLAMSGDGLVLAASTLGNSAPGSISTFRFDDTSDSWEPMGSPVVGDSALESFGVSITLSQDGLILATGAPDFSRNGEEPKVGIVRTYRFDEDQQEWLPLGRPVEGENAFDNFGSSVALSKEGDVLVVGAPDNDDFCDNCGHVRVFAHNLTESLHSEGGAVGADVDVWIPVGSPLGTNETDGGKYGSAVAISSNGTRVVGSAPFTTFNGFVSSVGQVHVFDLDEEQ